MSQSDPTDGFRWEYNLPDGFWEELERVAWEKSFISAYSRKPFEDTELMEWMDIANVPSENDGKIDIYRILELSDFEPIRNTLLTLSDNHVHKEIIELALLNVAFYAQNGCYPRNAIEFGKWLRDASISWNVDARSHRSIFFWFWQPTVPHLVKTKDSKVLLNVRNYLEIYDKAWNIAFDKICVMLQEKGNGLNLGEIERALPFDPFKVLDDDELAELSKMQDGL